MSNILAAGNSFDKSIDEYSQERESKQHMRSSHTGRAQSRAFGAFAALGTLVSLVAIAETTQLVSLDSEAMIIGVTYGVGIATYAAHQLAPYTKEIMGKVKDMAASVPNIGNGIGGAFSRFGKALGSLGDSLNLTSGSRALKAEAQQIKEMMGVANPGAATRLAKSVYGKQDGAAIAQDISWLRKGIDQAVKDKISTQDKSPISYNDIQTGILKQMEKSNVLSNGIESARPNVHVMENIRLMVGSPDVDNQDMNYGDISKILDDKPLEMLKKRDADKGDFSPS